MIEVTWCDKMDKRACHLPSGCTHMGMREGKITKAFGISSSTDTFYEFVVDSNCSFHEVINLKSGQFSYTLVEEWLRNDMIKEAIRTLDRKIKKGDENV
jgi:hypothetical protein